MEASPSVGGQKPHRVLGPYGFDVGGGTDFHEYKIDGSDYIKTFLPNRSRLSFHRSANRGVSLIKPARPSTGNAVGEPGTLRLPPVAED